MFDAGLLRAVALEQSAGELGPEEAIGLTRAMVGERRILTLEGGRMTTLAIRAQEQAIERRANELAEPAGRDVGEQARAHASREVAECIGAPLSVEQEQALRAVTGPERIAVLVGPAGTGKGVVLDAAARAEQIAGREVFGIAVSGSTAERLGIGSPSLEGHTLTMDALVVRANSGRLQVGPETTVILDEAGMVDHKRLDALTELVERSGAKLVAVGDGRQLPSIGPGGMFDRIAHRVPTAELEEVRRTSDPQERKAWAALRNGEPERAMAHYKSRSQLFLTDTREQAGEAAVKRWAELTGTREIREVALITDASNVEVDRLNARAQHLRAERGELGQAEIQLPHKHYGLREGDRIVFTSQHREPGHPRVENGSRGQVTSVDLDRGVTVALDISERHVTIAGEDLESPAAGVRPAHPRPAGRNRRSHRCRDRGLADQQRRLLRGGQPRPPRHGVVREPRRARPCRTGREARREALGEDADKPRADTLSRASRATGPRLGARPRTHPLPRRPDPAAHRPATRAETRPRPGTRSRTMSRKIQIVLPDPAALQLQLLADGHGEPLATFARHLVCDGIALAATEGRVRAPVAAAGNPGSRGGRPTVA